MNTKNTKAVRRIAVKAAKRNKAAFLREGMREIMTANLWTRIKFCALVLKGSRHERG